MRAAAVAAVAAIGIAPEAAGRMAAKAGVRMLVRTHLLPGATPQRGGALPDASDIDAVRKHFSGEAVVGRDQRRL